MHFELPPRGSLPPNNDVDPLKYYYAPLVGRVFVARIERGLRLMPPGYERPDGRIGRLLEIGYGAGLLLPSLSRAADVVDGVDLASDPDTVRSALARIGVQVGALVRGSATALPFADGTYDAAVAFSLLEHLPRPALDQALLEAARVIKPGGHFLVGVPAVNKAMTLAFRAIGFRGIDDHHVSDVHDVRAAAEAAGFRIERTATLPFGVPLGWAPYNALLLRRSNLPAAPARSSSVRA